MINKLYEEGSCSKCFYNIHGKCSTYGWLYCCQIVNCKDFLPSEKIIDKLIEVAK